MSYQRRQRLTQFQERLLEGILYNRKHHMCEVRFGTILRNASNNLVAAGCHLSLVTPGLALHC